MSLVFTLPSASISLSVSLTDRATAIANIATYQASALVPAIGIQAFTIAASDLLNYIIAAQNSTAISGHRMKYLHLCLGQSSLAPTLSLYLVGVASNKNHIWVSTGPNTFNVLSCPYSASPLILAGPNPGINLNVDLNHFSSVEIPFNDMSNSLDGLFMINSYNAMVAKNTTAFSFLMEPDMLESYLYAVNRVDPNSTIEFFLAVENGRLTIIAIGIDSSSNFLYINDPAPNMGNCALEHVCPCPCNDVNGSGITLEV